MDKTEALKVAQKYLYNLTDETMTSTIKPTMEEDLIPSHIMLDCFNKYNDTLAKEFISFKEYLYENTISRFDDDIKYHEEYLVSRLLEHISDRYPELCETFQNMVDTINAHDLLTECGYKETKLDIESAVDRPYHINLIFNEQLSYTESFDAFMKQQGHTPSDVFANPITNNQFIQSVRSNIADMGDNLTLQTSQITALISLKGKELLSVLDGFSHDTGNIVLSQDTALGFYNAIQGKSSSFTIRPEKEIVLAVSSLSNVQFESFNEPDDVNIRNAGVAVSQTHNLDPNLWERGNAEVQKEAALHKGKNKKSFDMDRE